MISAISSAAQEIHESKYELGYPLCSYLNHDLIRSQIWLKIAVYIKKICNIKPQNGQIRTLAKKANMLKIVRIKQIFNYFVYVIMLIQGS